MRLLMLAPLLITLGCSSKGSSPAPIAASTYPWNSFSVASDSDLPTCSGDILGRLYFIESSSSFKVCKSTGWTAIDVRGTDGANGAPGMTISSIVNCSKISSSPSVLVFYRVVTYSTNDKFVFCSIQNGVGTFSASVVYKASQSGVLSEACTVGLDLDTATAGYWTYTLSGSTRTAIYTDSGSASNGTSISFASSDCSTVN